MESGDEIEGSGLCCHGHGDRRHRWACVGERTATDRAGMLEKGPGGRRAASRYSARSKPRSIMPKRMVVLARRNSRKNSSDGIRLRVARRGAACLSLGDRMPVLTRVGGGRPRSIVSSTKGRLVGKPRWTRFTKGPQWVALRPFHCALLTSHRYEARIPIPALPFMQDWSG